VHSRKAILAFCRLAHRTVRCTTGHCPVRISFLLWRSRPLALWSHLRTGHCPVPPSSRWRSHTSRTDYAADRWLIGQSGVHRTVRCSPDSPVNYSCTPLITSREQQVRLSQPGAPDTVRCTTGQSGAPRASCLWLNKAIFNFNLIFPISST
jgi:hypothetical protein